MLKNNKGFSLIEVLVAFSIIFMVATTLIPIASLVEKELETLSQRRINSNRLHDELQLYLWDKKLESPLAYSKIVDSKKVLFLFTLEDEFMKGCVEWQNVKQTREKFCLYGIPQK